MVFLGFCHGWFSSLDPFAALAWLTLALHASMGFPIWPKDRTCRRQARTGAIGNGLRFGFDGDRQDLEFERHPHLFGIGMQRGVRFERQPFGTIIDRPMKRPWRANGALSFKGEAAMNNRPDQQVLDQLVGKVVGDVAGAMGVFMAYLGDRAGVYHAMDEAGPSSPMTFRTP